MFERAVVHIGLHKTGTTSIQATLHRHAAALEADQGVYYPRLTANHSVILFPLFCDKPQNYYVNQRANLKTERAAARHNAKITEKLDAEFAATNAKTLLVSGEDLSTLSAEGYARMNAWFKARAKHVEVVAFVRDPIAWATSAAQQRIKSGATFAELMKRVPREAARHKLGSALAVFGRDALRVHRFEDAARNGVLPYFCKETGIEERWAHTIEPETLNESFSNEGVHLIAAINALYPIKPSQKFAPKRAHADIQPLAAVQGEKFRLPPEMARQASKHAKQDIDWLKDALGIDYGDARTMETPVPDALSLPLAADFVVAAMSSAKVRELMLMAENALLKGDTNNARKHCRESLTVDPDNTDAKRLLKEINARPSSSVLRRALSRMLKPKVPG